MLTVADVAALAGTTERTVRRDIAAGVLPSKKLKSGGRRVRAADAKRYRAARSLASPHVKVEEFARLSGRSLRTIRRLIASQVLRPIRVSARRIYLPESEAQRVWGIPLGGFPKVSSAPIVRDRAFVRTRRVGGDVLLTHEAAAYLGIGERWLLRAVKRGDVRDELRHGTRIFRQRDLDHWRKRCTSSVKRP